MDLRAALIVDGQATEFRQSGEGSLDHPAMASQPRAELDAAAGHPRDEVAIAASAPATRQVVGRLGMEFGRAFAAMPVRVPNQRNRIKHRLQGMQA